MPQTPLFRTSSEAAGPKVLLLLLLLLCPLSCLSASSDSTIAVAAVTDSCAAGKSDSVTTGPKVTLFDRLSEGKLFRSTYIGVPLIVGGLIEKHQDSKFRNLRNDFLPRFRNGIDNYMQFTPAAVLLGLKAAGVKSRDSWGRLTVSAALSAAMMATVVQGLKHTTRVWRPDGSDNHSFPSGHTATAFMTATMLTKEYGYKSKWVGIGAYTLATATGLMRVANNKHWLSDVMTGAGIGTIATEAGYWIADLIFRNKGMLVPDGKWMSTVRYSRKPSFLSLYVGMNLPLSDYDLKNERDFETSTGTSTGLEGAYFFSRNFGVGGRALVSDIRYILDKTEAGDNRIHYYSAGIGPYFSLPVTARIILGSKILGGLLWYPTIRVGQEKYPSRRDFFAGSGISADYRVRENVSGGIFMDWNVIPPQNSGSAEYMNTLTLGGRVSVMF